MSFSIADTRIVFSTGAIAPFAGFILLYRRYERVTSRIAYIGLLLYWFIFVAGAKMYYNHIFNTILWELMRFPQAKHGERDIMGKHWSTNIAETFSMTAVNTLLEPFAESHFWKLALLNVFLVLFVFGHHVFQLWMQKCVAKLSRWNHNAWRWRELAIEYLVQLLIRKLDSPMTRTMMRSWWSSWYWLYGFMDSPRISSLSQQLFALRLILRSSQVGWLCSLGIRYLLLWLVCIRELARFANPDPPEYKYSPLEEPDHIRVLLLHPRFGFRPISCSLLQGPHMRLLFFEAISYTWGKMGPTEEIIV
jgi:hypothetical protein